MFCDYKIATKKKNTGRAPNKRVCRRVKNKSVKCSDLANDLDRVPFFRRNRLTEFKCLAVHKKTLC